MAADAKEDVLHQEDARTLGGAASVPENPEDEMSAWQCLKSNPKIVLCALYANIGALMIGYDNLALAVCLSMPAFQ